MPSPEFLMFLGLVLPTCGHPHLPLSADVTWHNRGLGLGSQVSFPLPTFLWIVVDFHVSDLPPATPSAQSSACLQTLWTLMRDVWWSLVFHFASIRSWDCSIGKGSDYVLDYSSTTESLRRYMQQWPREDISRSNENISELLHNVIIIGTAIITAIWIITTDLEFVQECWQIWNFSFLHLTHSRPSLTTYLIVYYQTVTLAFTWWLETLDRLLTTGNSSYKKNTPTFLPKSDPTFSWVLFSFSPCEQQIFYLILRMDF